MACHERGSVAASIGRYEARTGLKQWLGSTTLFRDRRNVSNSKRTTPAPHTSAANEYGSPRNTSGASCVVRKGEREGRRGSGWHVGGELMWAGRVSGVERDNNASACVVSGAHVVWCADHRLRKVRVCRERAARAKVAELDDAVAREEHVGRLHVAVQHALRVHVLQRGGELARPPLHLCGLEEPRAARRDSLGERAALGILHLPDNERAHHSSVNDDDGVRRTSDAWMAAAARARDGAIAHIDLELALVAARVQVADDVWVCHLREHTHLVVHFVQDLRAPYTGGAPRECPSLSPEGDCRPTTEDGAGSGSSAA
jgi:hypothetical protein